MFMNEQMPLVSIIVPAYNVEHYIKKCMQSLLKQTYQNIEIILVDDGSTDKTLEICSKYSEKDARVRVYHQKNSGQAVARNFAFSVAQGEYIIYVDSDDYVSIKYVEKLLDQALKYQADIVECYAQKFWNGGKKGRFKIEHQEIKVYSASKALEEFCYQRKFNAAPWAKIIRKELLNDLPFPSNTGYEDMAIMYRLIGKAKRIVLLPEVLYFYRQHDGSTMHTDFSDKKVDRIRIAEKFKYYIEENYPENIKAMKTRYLLAQLQLLMDLPYNKEYSKLRKQIKDNIKLIRLDVIKDSKSKTNIRLMAVTSYLGMPMLMGLGRLYKKVIL